MGQSNLGGPHVDDKERHDAESDDQPAASTRAHARTKGRRPLWVVLWVLVGLIVATGAFVGVALYTDRPAFCNSCHEMGPYFVAWTAGKHADVSCIQCHVDPGMPARIAHKFVALAEVRAHVMGDTGFPLSIPPDVPAERCLVCHPSTPETTASGFPHGRHARKGTCAGCHRESGHAVTAAALQAAGIYVESPSATIPVGAFAAVGAGTANVTSHVAVTCSNCHDLAKTGCTRCHTPRHKPRGDCQLCHRAGEAFKFVHPASGVDCASCHKRPSGHTDDTGCLKCHDKPGKTWMYTHSPGQDCAKCHQPPAKHRSGACTSCHRQQGKSWAFSHPGSNSTCRSCHQPPSGHYAGSCTRCHHRVGVSFVFSHPSAGEHSWRSRPCKKCHPSGGSTVYCSCHGGHPPSD